MNPRVKGISKKARNQGTTHIINQNPIKYSQ